MILKTGGAVATAYPVMMIMATCSVNVIRSQNPEPNHCAVCITPLPLARHAANTMATATVASANASGNQRSNQFESCRPMRGSHEPISLFADCMRAKLYTGLIDRLVLTG